MPNKDAGYRTRSSKNESVYGAPILQAIEDAYYMYGLEAAMEKLKAMREHLADYTPGWSDIAAKSLVEQQFGKSANSDRNRIDNSAEERIKLAQLILDINNPLPEPRGRNAEEDVEIQDAALMEIFAGQLRSTKGI